MKRTYVILVALVWALLAFATGWAVTRINGNQLLEGTGEFGFARRTAKGEPNTAPRIVHSLGQGVMARGEIPDSATGPRVALSIGYGLAYDIAHYIVCPVKLTGDLTGDGDISASDLILLVQYVYQSAPAPAPCPAIGDVNCTGNLTAADAMVLVNYIFKSADPPCNVCAMIPDSWPCY